MEICGSIFTSGDYTEFYLKCIYCSIESHLKDWEQFVIHLKNAHSFDVADEGSVQSESASLKHDEFSEETDNYSVINEEGDIWPRDDVEFDPNYEFLGDEVVSQSPTDARDLPTSNGIYGALDNTEQYGSENESNLINEDCEELPKYKDADSSNGSEVYVNEDGPSSSDSDEEPEENPPKRSRTNPMTLKRKLKVSFIRQNPRVLHFIEEFKKHPCLWDPGNPKFDDEKVRTEAYNTITEVMDKKVNVLFTDRELKKSIAQLLDQYAIASRKAEEKNLTGMAARYFSKCKFLSNTSGTPQTDDEEGKSDVIQLNFKKINEITSTFIDIFANFPVLYDTSSPEFKSIDARTQAYIKMSELLAPKLRVNETEVHLAVMRLRKWAYMALRRVKSKVLQRPCSKTELHYLQLCSFLPPKMESFVLNCELCDKRFFIDYLLRAHMVKVHNVGELPYLCSQCPRRFEKTNDMDRHKLRQHCERMFKCDYCESTFAVKPDLNVHLRIHTGEKPYVCELCGKSFRLKLLLDYHINGRHFDLRPFSCDLCPKTFRKRVQLKNHMKAHLNIKDKKCDICGAAFTCPTSLSRHRKTHQLKE